MWAENKLTTSSNASATITKKSTSIGPANASVASTSTGIISIAHAISVCPATSTTPSTSFNIPHPKNHRTAPSQQLSNSTGFKSNSLTPLTLPPAYLHTRSNGSNRSLALSSFTVVLSTQPFSLPSANSLLPKPRQQTQPNEPANNSLITVPLTLMAPYVIKPAT